VNYVGPKESVADEVATRRCIAESVSYYGPVVGKQKQGKSVEKVLRSKSDPSTPRARMPQVSPHGSLAELCPQFRERFSRTTMSRRSPCLCSKWILPKALVPSNTVKPVGARPFSFSRAFRAPCKGLADLRTAALQTDFQHLPPGFQGKNFPVLSLIRSILNSKTTGRLALAALELKLLRVRSRKSSLLKQEY
jgi:hypothetical protein